jgi:hypothetical protein
LAVASPAAAHDPIILTDEQVDAAGGPRLPDGTISFALYGVPAWYANAPPGAASTPPATGTPWATATPPLSASATTPASTGSATVAGAPASTGSGTVAEWLWPLLIATVAGATAVAVGLYHGFVRPGRTRR